MKKNIAILFVIFAFSANAHTPQYTNEFNNCLNNAVTTADNVACNNAEIKVQDELLNFAYQALQEILTDKQKIAVRDAQRAWIDYRDTTCAVYAKITGGTISGNLERICYLETTYERAQYLIYLYELSAH